MILIQDFNPNLPPMPPKDGEIARPAQPPRPQQGRGSPLTAKPTDKALPAKPLPAKSAAPQKQDWKPVDLSHGVFKDKELFSGSRKNVVRHLRDEIKTPIRNFETRNEFAKRLADKRGHGITRKEFKDVIGGMKKEGKLKDFQARQLRRQFKSFK